MKITDWSQTPIYFQYVKYGRYIKFNERMYSEEEVKYNLSYLKQLSPDEASKLKDEYFDRTVATLDELLT